MTFCFDIDGVLMTTVPDNDYRRASPIRETVALVNALHDAGHTIILFTARGTMTGLDWRDVTSAQMADAGVRYHRLQFGKPAADFYVDDRMLTLDGVRAFLDGAGKDHR